MQFFRCPPCSSGDQQPGRRAEILGRPMPPARPIRKRAIGSGYVRTLTRRRHRRADALPLLAKRIGKAGPTSSACFAARSLMPSFLSSPTQSTDIAEIGTHRLGLIRAMHYDPRVQPSARQAWHIQGCSTCFVVVPNCASRPSWIEHEGLFPATDYTWPLPPHFGPRRTCHDAGLRRRADTAKSSPRSEVNPNRSHVYRTGKYRHAHFWDGAPRARIGKERQGDKSKRSRAALERSAGLLVARVLAPSHSSPPGFLPHLAGAAHLAYIARATTAFARPAGIAQHATPNAPACRTHAGARGINAIWEGFARRRWPRPPGKEAASCYVPVSQHGSRGRRSRVASAYTGGGRTSDRGSRVITDLGMEQRSCRSGRPHAPPSPARPP